METLILSAQDPKAAGTAAAMSTDFTKIDVAQLQRVLKENGVILHEKELPSRA